MATLREILDDSKIVEKINFIQDNAYSEMGGYEEGEINSLRACVEILEEFIERNPQTVEEAFQILKEIEKR